MKKLTKLLSCLAIAFAIVSCTPETGNNIIIPPVNIIPQEPITPDEPINRDNTLTVSNVVDIEIDVENDFSAYEGKKAFLIAMNQDAATRTAFKNKSKVTDSFIDSLPRSDNNYFSIPYNAPEFNIPVNDISEPLSRNILKTENQSTPAIGDTRNFYAFTSNDRSNSEWAKNSVLKVIGNHCYVWFKEKEGITVTQENLETLASTFDSIFEKETYIFGKNTLETQPASSIINVTDENIKINIIVYDIFDDFEETKANHGGIYGYFAPLDFQNTTEITVNEGNETYSIYSNRCECLHIDSYFLQVEKEAQQSTIAHEFQHLLHYVNKSLKYGPITSTNGNKYFRTSETWFNEMMSMVCEDIMQSQLNIQNQASPKSRLSIFNAAHYLGFKKWRNSTSDGPNDVYASYANSYAFGAYLLRNYGIDFIKILASNNYINETAITEALKAVNASEKSFTEVFNKYYNVILNPKATEFTLNKSVSKTYTIAGSPVTFNCDAINLFDYRTFNKNEITADTVGFYYQAAKYNDYYGPAILNNRLYRNLDGYGMFVSYMGIVGNDFSKTFKLASNKVGDTGNQYIKYKLAFIE